MKENKRIGFGVEGVDFKDPKFLQYMTMGINSIFTMLGINGELKIYVDNDEYSGGLRTVVEFDTSKEPCKMPELESRVI